MASAMMISIASSNASPTVTRMSKSSSAQTNGIVSAFNGLKSTVAFPAQKGSVEWDQKTTTNGNRVHCMQVWPPINNKKFETLSYLPPLNNESVVKEIDYMLSKGWIPCLEFDAVGHVHRTNHQCPGYYDGRYWTLWKLPMFGCTNSAQVLGEITECKKAYPNAFIRCLAFDNQRQAQCIAFIVHKPE
eukprot:Gb_16477 [translate_table: standard]